MTKPNWLDEACKQPPTTAEQVVIELLARQEAERQRDEALQLRDRAVDAMERDLAEARRLLVKTEHERDEARAEVAVLQRGLRGLAVLVPEPLAQVIVILATKGDKDAVQALRTAVEASAVKAPRTEPAERGDSMTPADRSSTRLWRALVRVLCLADDGGCYVVVPGWDHRGAVRLELADLPEDIAKALVPGFRLHAMVNIGADSPSGLVFENWEIRSLPAPQPSAPEPIRLPSVCVHGVPTTPGRCSACAEEPSAPKAPTVLDAAQENDGPKIPKGDFYDCRDREELRHESPEEALEEWIELWCTPDCDVSAVIREHSPVTLLVFRQDEVDDVDLTSWAQKAVDDAQQAFDDEYGDPEGGTDNGLDDGAVEEYRTAVRAALVRFIGHGTVWRCTQIASIILDAEQAETMLREYRPDWWDEGGDQ